MYDPILVEHHYNSFVRDIKSCAPDGLIKITPELIKELDIQLNYDKSEPVQSYCYFYVLESKKKITLINKNFIVWIVPINEADKTKTYIMIAENHDFLPKLEMIFETEGEFNSPAKLLRVLEKILEDIMENKKVLGNYRDNLQS